MTAGFMSFFGGGTDMAEFYEAYGGAVLSATFDKYCYVNIRHLPRFFDYRTHLTYSKTECVNALDEIEHPLIREAMGPWYWPASFLSWGSAMG